MALKKARVQSLILHKVGQNYDIIDSDIYSCCVVLKSNAYACVCICYIIDTWFTLDLGLSISKMPQWVIVIVYVWNKELSWFLVIIFQTNISFNGYIINITSIY